MRGELSLRGRAYAWLAEQFGRKAVHIGEMTIEECDRVVEICKAFVPGVGAGGKGLPAVRDGAGEP